jgi:hypothetical protein
LNAACNIRDDALFFSRAGTPEAGGSQSRFAGAASLPLAESSRGRKRKRAGASRELRVGHGEKKKIVVEIAVSPLSAAYPRMPRSNDNTSLTFRIISFLDLQVLFLSLESFFVGILWELYM